MSRIPPEIDESIPTTSASPVNGGDGVTNASSASRGGGFRSIRDRFSFSRNPNVTVSTTATNVTPPPKSPSLDRPFLRNRLHQAQSIAATSGKATSGGGSHHGSHNRRGFLSRFPLRGVNLLYFVIFLAVFSFAVASLVLQSSIAGAVFGGGDGRHRRRLGISNALSKGSSLRFVAGWRLRQVVEGNGLDEVRLLQGSRVGIRPPRLALILGNMNKDPQSLLLITVVRSLQRLGFVLKIYAVENGKAQSLWEQTGHRPTILGPDRYSRVDWSSFEGIIADSLESKDAISSLMQEPFQSVPLIWIIQEDTLANRLPMYEEIGWKHLVSHWRSAFNRADVIVFPDFSLPMLYSVLDTGNFFVIPGTPVDVWAAESYYKSHPKDEIRTVNRFIKNDIVVLVVGSTFIYDELSWDYALAMHAIGPLLVKYARAKDAEASFKFMILCGNSSDGDAMQEITSRLSLLPGSVVHYGMNDDVNSVLLMADIVLYGSSQDEQGFPPLIIRAMTFGLPVIAPDFPAIRKYVTTGVNGMLFQKDDPESLMRSFSLLVSDGKLSELAQVVASSGRLLAKNVLASECTVGYARLLENVLKFPSDALLPGPVSQLRQDVWDWNLFTKEMEQEADDLLDDRDSSVKESSIVYTLEEELTDLVNSIKIPGNETGILVPDMPTELDWNVLQEIESSEEFERVETEEVEERLDKSPGVWDEIYRNVRKSEKLRFEVNERDEGELERTGQPVCIYEIYDGPGAWPFLHHGSLYRGLALSTKARRSRSDDVNAVTRLPLLNDTDYQNKLCEIMGMFSIANKVDNIHKRPWIGFQSWHAAGRKVSLSPRAEKVLEENIQKETKGDVMYFWARLYMDGGITGRNSELTFWSMCDILNGGHCRTSFQDAFRHMYALPSNLEALPPMPEDGGHWSALHSWVMPTPSFLEFIMFSRMFVDSLDALQTNSSQPSQCLLSTSDFERRHCYCRILELLVNVWAYHSGRKMIYIDPVTGSLEEQHPFAQRRGIVWAKYFDLTLLKSMDEDLAEAADDGDHPRERWLWPLTGEVHWLGIYDREREERYRLKMDKKRKTKEKLYERMKSGYKQKTLG